MDDLATLLADLEAEQVGLQVELADIGVDDWFRPTVAKGWDVRDTVAHLADTDQIALDTCTGGERPINDFHNRLASAEDLTFWGVLRGRKRSGADVLAWWVDTSSQERELLASLDPAVRVPWGLGMRPTSFVTARLMETWAHSVDVREALGLRVVDSERLRHIAWLSIRALAYAFTFAGRAPFTGPLYVELTPPNGGDPWTFGPPDAADRITGSAGEFCRLFVQRLRLTDARTLQATGDGAQASLEVARAYL